MDNKNQLTFYCVVDNSSLENSNDFEELKNILEEVGVRLYLKNMGENSFFSITLDKDVYQSKKSRGAGRHFRKGTKSDDMYEDLKLPATWADVVYMMQTMSDKEIAAEIDMPIATYYRHKKRMKESKAFQNLDQSRLQDKEYLENHIYRTF